MSIKNVNACWINRHRAQLRIIHRSPEFIQHQAQWRKIDKRPPWLQKRKNIPASSTRPYNVQTIPKREQLDQFNEVSCSDKKEFGLIKVPVNLNLNIKPFQLKKLP